MNAQPGTVTISAAEYAKLCNRVTRLEQLLHSIMMNRRQTLIMEISHIEDALELPRTKEKRVR